MDELDAVLAAIFRAGPPPERVPAARQALRCVAEARRLLDELEAELVPVARRAGGTWRQLAEDLDVPRSTLADRHRG